MMHTYQKSRRKPIPENWYHKPARKQSMSSPIRYWKLVPEQFGTRLHHTRQKPIPVFWYQFFAPISGECVIGISLSERQSIKASDN